MIDLRQGDCLEIMKDIPDKSIDMILCDLPYGTTRNKWDSIIPLDKLWNEYERIIKVDAIKDIESILEKSDFNDILYWILNDKDLYSHIISDIEISDDAYMSRCPPKKQDARFVRKSQMKSWLNKVFMEYEWLPTLSNKKVNSYNCTLAQHKLSPIVEVLNVNYESLNSLFNRNQYIRKIVNIIKKRVIQHLYALE